MRLTTLAVVFVLLVPAADLFAAEKLTGTVEVNDLQGGFAGFSGTFTTIKTSGTWTRESGLQDRTPRQRTGEGKLSAANAGKLAKAFSDHGFSKLPETIAEYNSVNPKVYEVQYGKKVVRVILKPGGNLPFVEGAPKTDLERIAVIVDLATQLTSK